MTHAGRPYRRLALAQDAQHPLAGASAAGARVGGVVGMGSRSRAGGVEVGVGNWVSVRIRD